jgi:hypothetical protein
VKIDVLYLCHGRIEFTRASLPNLIARTDWPLVNELVVYNDSTPERDGETSRFVKETLAQTDMEATLRQTNLGSPVAVMNHFLRRTTADAFAKIDNDIIVCAGWLEALTDILERYPKVELVGMQPGMGSQPGENWNGSHEVEYATHIGGVGLMRTSAFERRGRPIADGRFGFTEWQHKHTPGAVWIKPDLQMFALDQLPFEPWLELTADYVKAGLNREWPTYPRKMDWYWDWWDEPPVDAETWGLMQGAES